MNALLAHPGVDAVSFVGSTPIARQVCRTGTTAGKRVQALGGAKNHMVVLPDADLDAAADAAINAGYGSAGERWPISVIVAVGGVADPLVDAIQRRIPEVVTSAPATGPTDDGPARHGSTATRWRPTWPAPRPEGARVVVDGSAAPEGDGFYFGCALLDDVKPGMRATTTRSSVRALGRAGRLLRRRRGARERQPTATAWPSSRATAPPAASSARSPSA